MERSCALGCILPQGMFVSSSLPRGTFDDLGRLLLNHGLHLGQVYFTAFFCESLSIYKNSSRWEL